MLHFYLLMLPSLLPDRFLFYFLIYWFVYLLTYSTYLFVYVTGLHAVQACMFDKHVVLLPINYRASENFFFVQSLFKAKLNVRAKTIQFILNWTVCIN